MLRKEQAQHQPLDINEVVEESLRLMRSDLLNRDVAVDTELAARCPPSAATASSCSRCC